MTVPGSTMSIISLWLDEFTTLNTCIDCTGPVYTMDIFCRLVHCDAGLMGSIIFLLAAEREKKYLWNIYEITAYLNWDRITERWYM